MNYFELFEIPVSFIVEPKILKAKFFQLSRKYHPDFFTNSTEQEQEEALEKSALLNKAFKTLTNFDETVKYVLQLKGLLTDEEKYQLNNIFLMNVMELNEALMDAKFENDTIKINEHKQEITQLQQEIYEPVKNLIENYSENTATQKELLQIKEFYYQKKYLRRILDGLG